MNYLALLPPVLMAIFACSTLLLDVLSDAGSNRRYLVPFNVIGQAAIAWSLLREYAAWRGAGASFSALQGAVTIDGVALFSHGIVWLAMLVLLLTSSRYLEIVSEHRGEYYALALCAQCGMYFMASGADMISIFVGLELTSISFYILVGFLRSDRRSNEAALKYLLLGALSSAFVLYGFSLVYGVTGTTDLGALARMPADTVRTLATVMILAGLLFKIAAAPFHSWSLDAYDGAPTPVTSYLAVASKIAAFALVTRVVLLGTTPAPLLIAVAVISLTIGSIAAITQERLKRLFAYSGVAHAGYTLLGLAAGSVSAVLIYLGVYAVMTLGTFAVLTSLRTTTGLGEEVADLEGLSRSHPVHAALFAVLLLSLAGVPPTAGFIGKYFIFAQLIKTGHIALAVIASVYVAVSLYFYFRLVRAMYLESGEKSTTITESWGVRLTLGAAAFGTLLIGIFPQTVLGW